MPRPSFLEAHFGQSRDAFVALNHEQRIGAVRAAVSDLNRFFDEGRPLADRPAPARTLALAQSLHDALASIERHGPADEAAAQTLADRIVTNELLRVEADRDQNVYVGRLFTRVLTHAVPDLIVQPASLGEAAAVFAWARAQGVPVTLRGAASTALGGSVPNDGGVTMDLTRLDLIDIDAADGVCVVGAGARLRAVHTRLAERGQALAVYPSNLGGTLAGWFVTGGIGLNAFGHGRALDAVRVADVILPAGEHVRFHADGRLDVPASEGGPGRVTLAGDAATEWFRARGYAPLTLADFAGSEGTLGLVLQLSVRVVPRPELGAFLLSFERREQAFEAIDWLTRSAGERFPNPMNVKLVSGSHLHHVRRVWMDEDARAWHRAPGDLSGGAGMPWTRITGPAELGAATAPPREHAAAYLFVDFAGADAARAFATALGECPGAAGVESDSARFAADRFRPMQTKRLGPGLLAAEVVMPLARVRDYLAAAERVTRSAGLDLDAEVYALADGTALVIAAFLTDHRRASLAIDLVVVAALVDLGMRDFGGRPYVLGRWQAAWFDRALGARASRLRDARQRLDPAELVSRGVLTRLRLHGALGALLTSTFVPGVAMTRALLAIPVTGWIGGALRALFGLFPGPAAGRGAPAVVGATFRASPPPGDPATAAESIMLAIAPSSTQLGANGAAPATSANGASQTPEDRALHCVNCGECNTVCPIFHEAGIRLPQMLTHLGEAMRAGGAIDPTGSVLLDLCMRCGNCEEVCQAGIPHLPMYERMQHASDRLRPRDVDRHTAIVATVRSSPRYRNDFLSLRGGMYLRRSPASLPGLTRYLVMRSENDAGPAATCIHCGACVPVCPTHANREFEGTDPRSITTVQSRCIGCGTCVEVCPANLANGGQTLRVMEAPTPDWFEALAEFDASVVSDRS